MVQNSPNRLTALHILIYLRQRLLAAIEKNDKGELQDLAKVFSMLWELVDKYNVQGGIDGVIENLTNTAIDYARGIGWKAIIPSEEDIKAALGEKDLTS
ncbi:MAG TPA: hypothetical protein VK206_10820 [Anaerolineales bacterium]|nr:hypothetical protein [Anaerolineales bacterium]